MIGLPALTGSPIYVRALPQLTAYRGKLLSAENGRGKPVHAASFIRRREIVLECELLGKRLLPLIVVHEIFHFVWVRLGNRKRAGYAKLLVEEQHCGATGELGASAAVQKRVNRQSREYICESFCDTASWVYHPRIKHPDATLAKRWRERRRAWFEETFGEARMC